MNFQPTLIGNDFLSLIKSFSPVTYHPKKNPSILPKLCQALKLSLQRFMVVQMQRMSQQEKISKPSRVQLYEPEIIELLSSDEEIQKQVQKVSINKKENEGKNKLEIIQIEEKTDLSKDHAQFQKESNGTNQQSLNIVRKTCLIRKQKLTKTVLKLKKQKYSQIEQNLDLTDTANIRRLPFSVQQLNRKRQALNLRKVLDWIEIDQFKKERREIRMLKN